MKKIILSSPAYSNNENMPAWTGFSNENLSVPLNWEDAPYETQSFALSMIDESAAMWKHWLVINIPKSVNFLEKGASNTDKMPKGAKELLNTWKKIGYGGPQPPYGTHDYEIAIYALDVPILNLDIEATNRDFLNITSKHLLGVGKLVGKFSN